MSPAPPASQVSLPVVASRAWAWPYSGMADVPPSVGIRPDVARVHLGRSGHGSSVVRPRLRSPAPGRMHACPPTSPCCAASTSAAANLYPSTPGDRVYPSGV